MPSHAINSFFVAICAGALHVSASAQTLIATGTDSSLDGYLAVRSDAFASWSGFVSPDPSAPADLYNPPGPAEVANVTFSTFLYLFIGDDQREILHDIAQGEPPHIDPSLSAEVISGPTSSDTNGDGVPDQLDSTFRVTSPDGATRLRVDLRQQVYALSSGISYLKIDADVLNEGARKIKFSLLRTWDADLPWSDAGGSAYYTNDEVGTGANASGPDRFVFVREPDMPEASVTLSGPHPGFYYGGKHGLMPAGGPPAYDFGTDIDWWLAYGVPHTWRNHVAGVGYDTDGASGSSPAGATDPEDAFCGVESFASLQRGETTRITFVHTYGQSTPAVQP